MNNYTALTIYMLLTPIIGSIMVMVLPKEYEQYSKHVALISSFITFFCSLVMWILFDKGVPQFQFVYNIKAINACVGVDGISLFFVVLTCFLIPICILSSWNSIQKQVKQYYALFLLLETCMLFVFVSLDLLLFYIFFESVLIPMFLIIGIWGSRERKIHAAYQLFLYTLAGSVLMLLSICIIYANVGSLNFEQLFICEFTEYAQLYLWISFFLAFSVKIPMIPFHIWLPEAHVEAPTAGSVILAGVLLKLGGYGFIRFSIALFPYANIYFLPFVSTLCIVGIIYTSITAIRQVDFKKLVAYTSIAHMNVVVLGIFTNSFSGLQGSILLMLSHGIVSSALFLLIGVLYDRHHTRLLKYYAGIGQGMPIYSSLLLFFSLCNFSLPGTSSFVGEFLVFFSIFKQSTFSAFVAGFGMVLGGVYSIWLVNRINGGYINIYAVSNTFDIERREFYIFVPLILSTLLMGIYPEVFMDTMTFSVQNLIDLNS